MNLSLLGEDMRGRGVSATPFGESERDSLRSACAEDEEIWPIYSTDFGPNGFDSAIDRILSRNDWCLFILRAQGGELIGMSSFLGIDPARQVLEIGATYYRPQFRGTGINPPIKVMMLQRAFECGIRRVEFRVDRRNARSMAAMAKLGAVREGVLRADRVTWTGHVRDTVLYSILAEEWASQSASTLEKG